MEKKEKEKAENRHSGRHPAPLFAPIGRSWDEMLRYAGYQQFAYSWLAGITVISLTVSFLLALIVGLVFPWWACLAAFLFALFVCYGIFYLFLYYLAEERQKRVERILPDLLQLVAANIRAGMTPILALRTAARPEFSPLTEEISYLTTKSMGIGSFTETLLALGKDIKSDLLERTLSLFATGLISGGNLPLMLDSVAEDVRETQRMQQQLMAGVNVYIIFIVFTIIVGMPLLFAVSLKYLALTATFPQTISGSVGFSASFVGNIVIITIAITALMASLLIGVAKTGRELSGLKYFFPICLLALAIFALMSYYLMPMFFGL